MKKKKSSTQNIPKKKQHTATVSIRCDPDVYKKLKDKCNKNDITIKSFFMWAIDIYVNEA